MRCLPSLARIQDLRNPAVSQRLPAMLAVAFACEPHQSMNRLDPASINPPSPDGFQHALEDEIREMLDVLATQERYLDLRLPDGRSLRSRVLFVDAAAR